MTTFRVFENRAGMVFNADEKRVLYAEDLNLICEAINNLEDEDLSVNSSTTDTTLIIAGDSNNFYNITALSSAITLANPSGTKAEGKRFIIRIKSDATPRAITYGSEWQAIGVTLPTTTVANKITALGGIINATTSKVEVWAVNQEE